MIGISSSSQNMSTVVCVMGCVRVISIIVYHASHIVDVTFPECKLCDQ